MTPRELIARHEGLSLKAYKDSLGYLTIGYGRLIDPAMGGGISQTEAEFMLDNDIAKFRDACEVYPWFQTLSEARKAAMLDLCFNLGPTRLAGFKKFLAAMSKADYNTAAKELESSKWYGQVKTRGPEIVNLIRNEVWPA